MSEIPWPKKGDKAFVAGDDDFTFYLRNIYPYYPYRADAFKAAADLLIDSAPDSLTVRVTDEIFFPIAYLYRHAFELRMKDIISAGERLGLYNNGELPGNLRTHNLAVLWDLARLAIIRRWKDGPEVEAVGEYIDELHRADPNGISFRYDPASQARINSNLPDSISPTHLRSSMDRIYTFLDTTASGLEQNLSDMTRY